MRLSTLFGYGPGNPTPTRKARRWHRQPVASGAGTTWTAIWIDGITLWLNGLESAEDGEGLVLRTCEPASASSTADIAPAQSWTLRDEVNILEHRLEAANLRFSPFNLRSWRVERVR